MSSEFFNSKMSKFSILNFKLISLEEESLAQRTVGLVRSIKPLANAGNVELVLAVSALHTG